MLGGRLLSAAVVLFTNVLLASVLSPADLGAYFLAFTVVNVAGTIALLGLHQTVVRLVAESGDRPWRAAAAVRASFVLAALGCAAVGLALAAGGNAWIARRWFESPALAGATIPIAVFVVAYAFRNLVAESFRGFHDLRSATLFSGVLSGVVFLAVLGALRATSGRSTFEVVLWANAAAFLTAAALGGLALARRVAALGPARGLGAGNVLRQTLPLLVVNAIAFCVTQADLWVLGAYRPAQEVALYGAAQRLVALVAMPLAIVNLIVPPFVAEMYAGGRRHDLQRLLRAAATACGVPAAGVLALFIAAGGPILGFVYADFYRSAAPVLAALSVGYLVNVLTGSCGVTMTMTGHQTTVMTIAIASGLLTLGLALAAVKPFGPRGVAVAAATGLATHNVAMWLATRRFTGLWTHVGVPRVEDLRRLVGVRR